MSGHSKWHTIKHKKGAADAKRGKVFTRIIKELTVAARAGGGDVDSNPRLRTIVAEAKSVNMPADNIKRAIQRGTGELPGVSYEEITYEGYGPGGAALIIETLTDNKNRTVGELRHMLGKYGGNLAAENSVAWMFDKKGYIVVDKTKAERGGADGGRARRRRRRHARRRRQLGDRDRRPTPSRRCSRRSRRSGIEPGAAEIAMLPQNYVKLEGKPAQQMVKLMEAARGSRGHEEGLVERRHRREGDRGLVGVRIFGIDPGSERTGYGCIESVGGRHRLVDLRRLSGPAARDVSREAEGHPRRAARAARRGTVPTASPSKTSSTPATSAARCKLGHARGVALLAACEAGLPVVEYAPGRDQARGRRLRPRREAAGAADDEAAARSRRRADAARRRRCAGRRDLPSAPRHRRDRRAATPRASASTTARRAAGAPTGRDRR